MKANILLVEDDENLGFILKDYLEMIGHTVTWNTEGKSGFSSFKQGNFDICILDVMMPIQDGFSLAEDIRKVNKTVPIVFLTAKSMKEDRIRGLKLGADDYITKPFSSEELSLRINAILRRYMFQVDGAKELSVYKIGDFNFNYGDQVLVIRDIEQRLTRKEADVLKLLCQNKNKLIRREVVLKSVWGKNDYFMGRSMDVYITKLRKYLKYDSKVVINNVHGTGFKLIDESDS